MFTVWVDGGSVNALKVSGIIKPFNVFDIDVGLG